MDKGYGENTQKYYSIPTKDLEYSYIRPEIFIRN